MDKKIYKARLAMLGKTSEDVRLALKKRGIELSAPSLSKCISRNTGTTHSERVLSAVDNVLKEWEGT